MSYQESTSGKKVQKAERQQLGVNRSLSKKAGAENRKGNVSQGRISIIRAILLVLIGIILFYPPYIRGLFFENEQMPAEILIFLVFSLFWVYKYLKNDRRFLVTLIDYASFGFLLVYLISVMFAVSTRLAVAEMLKYCMYFAVFLMVTELAHSLKNKRLMLWIMSASAFGVAVLGIDGGAGENLIKGFNSFFEKFHVPVNFFGIYVGGRINSTLQYPNALAAYLVAALLITVALIFTSEKLWEKCVAGGMGFVIFTAFIFTFSRGGYLVLAAALIILMILLPVGSKVRGLGYLVSQIVPLFIIVIKMNSIFGKGAGNSGGVWALVLAGITMAAVLTAIADKLLGRLPVMDSWAAGKALGITSVVAICIAVAVAIIAAVVLNTSKPLVLSNEGNAGNLARVKKVVELKPGEGYVFEAALSVQNFDKTLELYQIEVTSQSEGQIIGNKSTVLADVSEKYDGASGYIRVPFSVPEGSRVTNVNIINRQKETSIVLDKARILDNKAGKTIKKVVLNYMFLPKSFAEMFEGFSANSNVLSRQIFYRDGMKIIGDHWLFGAGGGAWVSLYMTYQSYLYFSNQAHNYLLQIGIDCGIIGIFIFIFLILSLAAYFISECRVPVHGEKKERILQAVLLSAIFALIAHSFVDFDLSLSAVFLLLWELIAIYNARYRNNTVKSDGQYTVYNIRFLDTALEKVERVIKGRTINTKPLLMALLSGALIILPISFNVGIVNALKASEASNKGDKELALNHLGKAISADWLKPEFKADYVRIATQNGNVDKETYEITRKYAESIEKKAKNNATVAINLGAYYLAVGDIEKGLKFVEHSCELRPLNPSQWMQMVDAYGKIAEYYFNKSDLNNFKIYSDKAMKCIEEAQEKNKRNMVPFIFNEATDYTLERFVALNQTGEDIKKTNINGILFYNIPWMDVNSDGIPDQWTPDMSSKNLKITGTKEKMTVENTGDGKVEFIQSRVLNLTKGRKYRIDVALDNAGDTASIPFAIATGARETMELKGDGNIFSAIVTAPELEKENSYVLRLGIKGRYEIKKIEVQQINE